MFLVVAALGSWEILWRTHGVESSFRDDSTLWSHARSRLASARSRQSAIIGSSRAQVDLVPEILAAAFDDLSPVMLAINGTSARPVLTHVADETRFDGVLLFEINPLHIFASSSDWDEGADEFLEHYLELPHLGGYEIDLRMALRERTVLLGPALAPRRVVRGWLAERSQPSLVLTLHSNRHRQIDFAAKADLTGFWLDYYQSTGTPLPIAYILGTVLGEAKRIRSRGGEVLLLRLPSSGELRRTERERFPREDYWDVLVQRSRLPAIHFEDYPELNEFDCPDGSHLDAADASEFSRRLVPILEHVLSRDTIAKSF